MMMERQKKKKYLKVEQDKMLFLKLGILLDYLEEIGLYLSFQMII